MFVKIGGIILNTDQITEIYDGGEKDTSIYFATSDGDSQAKCTLTPEDYARFLHALETKNTLYVA